MKLAIAKGSTNVTLSIFVQDSSSTTGAGLTALVYNSAGLTCYYVRPAAAAAALTLATQTTTGAHSDGGFVEIDATNMPGFYRLDLSDAIVASGVDSVALLLKGATNMAPLPIEIQLTDVDLNDGVRAGMTALPNAVADAAGGLPISDAGGLDLDAKLAATNEVTAARMGALTDWINGGRLDLILDIIAADVVNLDGAAMRGTDSAATAAALATVDSNVDAILVDTGTTLPATLATATALATVDSNVDAILVDTNALNDTKIPDTLSLAAINAEVDTALATTTYAEPGQGAPGATVSLSDKIGYLYKAWRNRSTQNATQYALYNDDATTIDQKATVSDDGTTADKGEVATGP